MPKLTRGNSDFRQKHAGAWNDSDAALVNQATNRPLYIKRSSVTRGSVRFLQGGAYGTKRVSIIPRDIVHVTRDPTTGNATKVEKQRMVHVKGQTDKNGKVGHYSGTTRTPQYRAMVAGGLLGPGIHVADHYVFKDAHIDGSEVCVARPATYGYGEVKALHAGAWTIKGSLGVKAHASAGVAHVRVQTKGIPGTGDLAAAYAGADALAAQAGAEAGVLGVRAGADATVGRAQAGFHGTPLQISASGPSAGASAGIHAGQIGASAGAYAGEAAAGPFAVRSGFKFGAGIENGVPVVHWGPVSAPCTIC